MADKQRRTSDALISQGRAVHAWLIRLSATDFERSSVLPGWDIRTLVGHLTLVIGGFDLALGRPTNARPVPAWEFVRRYRRDAAQIEAGTREISDDASGPGLVTRLAYRLDTLSETLSRTLPTVIDAPRGPVTVLDFTETRLVELTVHSDDLSRSLPERQSVPIERRALASVSRTLSAVLAGQSPGRSIEVRIPPYAAAQCGLPGDPGPTHTRGTPPNVVETDALTFLRLSTGRTSWAEARAAHLVSASGQRADLTPVLPLLS